MDQEPIIQQYITFYFGGMIYSEEQTTKVVDRDNPKAENIPAGAYGYRFFERQLLQSEGEEMAGPMRAFSGFTYFGRELTLEQVESEFGASPNHQILLSNLRCNDHKRVCLTVRGNWKPMQEGDRVMDLPEPPPPLTKAERFEALATERGMSIEKNEEGAYVDELTQALWVTFEPGA